MEYKNFLKIKYRSDFRRWLEENASVEKECYVSLYRGVPLDIDQLNYLDALEEALCFGWIDSTLRVIDGVSYQRFSPRRKNSHWTELNKERVRRLEKLGLMTELGRKTLPPLDLGSFKEDEEVVKELKKARIWSKFKSLHTLYQRIRLSNLSFYRTKNVDAYKKMLMHIIAETKKGNMYGQWNDYGRLLDY